MLQLMVRKGKFETLTITICGVQALDAPGLRDDFYASLLDWSKQNVVSVALKDAIWLRQNSDGQVCRDTAMMDVHFALVKD